MRVPKFVRGSKGQALVETVLLMPLLLAIVLNAINFAYFFLMALNITSSSRTSAIYSVMGGSTPAAIGYPAAGPMDCATSTTSKTVSTIACGDLTGAVYTPSTGNTGVHVCSPSVGILSAGTLNEKTDCNSYGMSVTFPASDVDPERNGAGTAPAFLRNRVDVAYRFSTPIPLMPFNIIVLATPTCTSSGITVTCTFYRHVVMRAM
jgi:hypothetical protein